MDKNIEKIILNKKLKKHEKLSSILRYLFVDIAKISQDKYYILGSFSIREYRQISDLDINLDLNEFYKLEQLTKKNIGKLEFYNNQIRWFVDFTKEYNKLTNENELDFSIEAFQKKQTDGFPNKSFSLKALRDNNDFEKNEDGHQFFNLKTLLKWKLTMNREKDKIDIELINNILAKNTKRIKVTKKVSKKKK
jgi:hypothetical protein